MSILGIRNTIKDQGLRVDVDPDKAPSTLGSMALTEDAMHDWQRKYPCDSWIPGTIYALEHFYAKIHTPEGVKHVHATFAWLRHDFPHNRLVAVALKENGDATDAPPIAPVTAGTGNGPASPKSHRPGLARAEPAGPAGTERTRPAARDARQRRNEKAPGERRGPFVVDPVETGSRSEPRGRRSRRSAAHRKA